MMIENRKTVPNSLYDSFSPTRRLSSLSLFTLREGIGNFVVAPEKILRLHFIDSYLYW